MRSLDHRNNINEVYEIKRNGEKNSFKLKHDFRDYFSENFYDDYIPQKFEKAAPIIINRKLIHELNLDEEQVMRNSDVLHGGAMLDDSISIAQAYGGSQFGYYTRLGDGRAALLGELDIDGDLYDLSLKGSGKNAYSRGGDGKATVGPMLREYIVSEFMAALGVPTTRVLSVFMTGEDVYRESKRTGAVLSRIAKSHIRVGTYQYIKEAFGDEELKRLADYTIKRHYPQLKDVTEEKYTKLLRNVVVNQASLISRWMSFGFIHGVMNTDNMTLSGETIDYGPCAFMEAYNKDQVFSSIDLQGRYRYINQPNIGMWNLGKLYESMFDILLEEGNTVDSVKYELEQYASYFNYFYMKDFGYKFGIKEVKDTDETIIKGFLEILSSGRYDFTNSFRDLTLFMMGRNERIEEDSVIHDEKFKEWFEEYKERIRELDGEEIVTLMKSRNPVIIPRNLVLDEALEKAESKDFTMVSELSNQLKDPFNYERELNKEYTRSMTESEERGFRTYCGT